MEITLSEVLKQAVIRLGGSKHVGGLLWPEKEITHAARLLCNCLDDHRAEKLSPDQALLILKKANEAGYHDAMHAICDMVGYSRPIPIEPADERAQLQKDFIAAKEVMASLVERMEKLG